MTDLDLEAIKARAKMATPGPWRVTEEGITNLTPDKDEHDQIAEIVTMHPSDVALLKISDADAAHIAGIDPTTTLALVDRIERLQDAPGTYDRLKLLAERHNEKHHPDGKDDTQ